MKIVFMGTPDFAIPSLKKIHESKHEVAAVVTAIDKERGRGQKLSYTPVKEFALQNNILVLQPEKLKDENFISQLKEINADLFVIVAFRILPQEVFTIPKYGSFNLHGSILPKYRGAAPIQWAIINGEKETGVTTFKLAEKVDTGNIYLQDSILINEDDNFEVIHDKLSLVGADLVLKTLDLIESGNYTLQQQDNSLASPAPKITKETGQLNFENTAQEVNNLIRGLSPFPGAYFNHNNKIIKVYKAKVANMKLQPGEKKVIGEQLYIGCKEGSIEILELQQEGRKKMDSSAFLRGYNF
ncbi:MAG: methionyl-tRNA formyltransferase [Syntrophothermus sp.]